MIRSATRHDAPAIINMLWNYKNAGGIDSVNNIDDDATARGILNYIFAGAGVALVSCDDNDDSRLTGMLLALKSPKLWNHNEFVMNEICFWVEVERRGSTHGYRLIQEYTDQCLELKELGLISEFTVSQMEGQSLNYARFGFKRIEETWGQ